MPQPDGKDRFFNRSLAPGETGEPIGHDAAHEGNAPSSHQGAAPQPPVAPTTPVSPGASLLEDSYQAGPHTPATPGASLPDDSSTDGPHTPAIPGESPSLPGRPSTRAECLQGPRPCPWIGCKWHLCWERRDIKRVIFSDAHPAMAASLILGMKETCVLDVAEAPRSDREVGSVLNISHQAVAQACQRGLSKLRAKRILKRGHDEVSGPSAPPAWRWGSGADRIIDNGEE